MSTDDFKGEILIDTALRYFFKHCPDVRAYFEDWTDDDWEEAHQEVARLFND